ncbi:hypothetical protein BV352_03365 [Pseudomonas syringae pv. actinidiae]|nr:hypothetical protein BV352_03365 [Pseudomonas syringae pv. actinidiae]
MVAAQILIDTKVHTQCFRFGWRESKPFRKVCCPNIELLLKIQFPHRRRICWIIPTNISNWGTFFLGEMHHQIDTVTIRPCTHCG